MKILHLCISMFYIDNYNYQENILPKQNKADGHEVKIIASTFSYKDNDNGKGYYMKPCTYINEDGIPVERCAYKRVVNSIITDKFRIVDGLYKKIEDFNPDVILFHGTSSHEIVTAGKYVRRHPHVKLYMDSHTDYYTSGTNFISRKILHGMIYKGWIKSVLDYIDKIFYISVGCGDFLREIYELPEKKIEFYSLGGFSPCQDEVKDSNRRVRKELGIGHDKIIIVQAGKLDTQKKVVESLRAFKRTPGNEFIYLLIGSLSQDIKSEVERLIKEDIRVRYLGWKSGNQLNEYLNACDIYVQPGKVSAIAQNAICRFCVVILNNLKEYRPFVKKNGWLIKDAEEMADILKQVREYPEKISYMKREAQKIANKYLNYETLAKRLY